MSYLKTKIYFGYLSLIAIASLAGYVIYCDIFFYRQQELKEQPEVSAITYVNNILSNLYKAEGMVSNYSSAKYLDEYNVLMDSILRQIDSLSLLVVQPTIAQNLDSIKHLLQIKRKNQKELYYIDRTHILNSFYDEAIEKLSTSHDTLKFCQQINTKLATTYDTTFVFTEKKTFISRFRNLFNSSQAIDSSIQVRVNTSSKVDRVIGEVVTYDSISNALSSIIADLQTKNADIEHKLKRKELTLLQNDHFISSQLKQLTSNIEKEQLQNSYRAIELQKIRLETTTNTVAVLGVLAVLSILFFLINILRDITKSKHYRESLEHAKNYAESLLKRKEHLMLSLTHDIKSPLNAIMGFTHILENDSTTHKTHKVYLNSITNASNHIFKLVQNLLDLARLEEGKIKIENQPFNFDRVLFECVDTFKATALAKNIDLQIHSDISTQKHYYGDAFRLTQILTNLVSNAMKFTNSGKVEVFAKAEEGKDDLEIVRVDIRDTGQGIDAYDLDAILEPFNRGTAQDKNTEGSGLGLSITQKLLELFNGSLYVESKLGEGSCFTIKIPFACCKSTVNELPLAMDKNDVSVLAGKKIWVIDDDANVLTMLTSLLEDIPMQVKSSNNSCNVIPEFQSEEVDFLLTDIQMPKMDGYELVNHLRNNFEIDFPIIAMSGLAYEGKGEGLFDAFINKPLSADLLLTTLMECNNKKAKNKDVKLCYTLKNVFDFASGDQQKEDSILASLVENETENIRLLKEYIGSFNRVAIGELAHKMLNIYRQLNAIEIVSMLEQLEAKDTFEENSVQYFQLAKSVRLDIKNMLSSIVASRQKT